MLPIRSILGFLLLFSIFTLLVTDESVAQKTENRCLATPTWNAQRDEIMLIERKRFCFFSINVRACDYIALQMYENDIRRLQETAELSIGDDIYRHFGGLDKHGVGTCVFFSTVPLKFDGSMDQSRDLLRACAANITSLTDDNCFISAMTSIEKRYYSDGKMFDPKKVEALLHPVAEKPPKSEETTEKPTEEPTTTEKSAIATGMLSAVLLALFSIM